VSLTQPYPNRWWLKGTVIAGSCITLGWVLLGPQVSEMKQSLQEIQWAKVGKWCSAKSQAPSSSILGLSLGDRVASFSFELCSLYHGQKVRGSVYCFGFPSQLHLSDQDQLRSGLLGDANTERYFSFGVCLLAAVDRMGALRCVVWFWPFFTVCLDPFHKLISIWTEIMAWTFQSNLFGVHVHIAFWGPLSQKLLKASHVKIPTICFRQKMLRGGNGEKKWLYTRKAKVSLAGFQDPVGQRWVCW